MPPRRRTSGRTPTQSAPSAAVSAVGPPPTGHGLRDGLRSGSMRDTVPAYWFATQTDPPATTSALGPAADGNRRRRPPRSSDRPWRPWRRGVRDPDRAEPAASAAGPLPTGCSRRPRRCEARPARSSPVVVGHPDEAAARARVPSAGGHAQRPSRPSPRRVELDERVARDVGDPEPALPEGERGGAGTTQRVVCVTLPYPDQSASPCRRERWPPTPSRRRPRSPTGFRRPEPGRRRTGRPRSRRDTVPAFGSATQIEPLPAAIAGGAPSRATACDADAESSSNPTTWLD